MTIFEDVRTAYAASGVSITSGIASICNFTTDNVALISTFAGLILCIFAIRGQYLSSKKTQLEILELERRSKAETLHSVD